MTQLCIYIRHTRVYTEHCTVYTKNCVYTQDGLNLSNIVCVQKFQQRSWNNHQMCYQRLSRKVFCHLKNKPSQKLLPSHPEDNHRWIFPRIWLKFGSAWKLAHLDSSLSIQTIGLRNSNTGHFLESWLVKQLKKYAMTSIVLYLW